MGAICGICGAMEAAVHIFLRQALSASVCDCDECDKHCFPQRSEHYLFARRDMGILPSVWSAVVACDTDICPQQKVAGLRNYRELYDHCVSRSGEREYIAVVPVERVSFALSALVAAGYAHERQSSPVFFGRLFACHHDAADDQPNHINGISLELISVAMRALVACRCLFRAKKERVRAICRGQLAGNGVDGRHQPHDLTQLLVEHICGVRCAMVAAERLFPRCARKETGKLRDAISRAGLSCSFCVQLITLYKTSRAFLCMIMAS